MLPPRELQEKFQKFVSLSVQYYGTYAHVAGVYETYLSNIILGEATLKTIIDRLDTLTEELQDRMNNEKK